MVGRVGRFICFVYYGSYGQYCMKGKISTTDLII